MALHLKQSESIINNYNNKVKCALKWTDCSKLPRKVETYERHKYVNFFIQMP